MTAVPDPGWHVYSQFMDEGGPTPTAFKFAASADYELVGEVKEVTEYTEKFDPTFLMPVRWFDGKAIFTQKVKLKVPDAEVKGAVTFMACTSEECLLPEVRKFSIHVMQ